MTPRFRHVMFDLDGTLADTSADLARAANHLRHTHGLAELSVEAVREWVGGGARQLVARVIPGMTATELDEALAEFLRHYESHLLDQTRLYQGISRLLATLRAATVSCSVLSNKPAALCQRLLDGLGIAAHFAVIVGGDSLPARKPDPAGIDLTEAHLGLPRTAMLLVGDSLVDRNTAANAGVAFCGVGWGFGAQALRAAGESDLALTVDDVLARVGAQQGRSCADRVSP